MPASNQLRNDESHYHRTNIPVRSSEEMKLNEVRTEALISFSAIVTCLYFSSSFNIADKALSHGER